MTEFKREERYIVIKRKNLSDKEEFAIRALLEGLDVGTVECVVVESDWPENETVWKMIEARVAGQPVEDPRDKVIELCRQQLITAKQHICYESYGDAMSVISEALAAIEQLKGKEKS